MKDNKIIYIEQETSLDIEPDRILGAALGELESVVVIGYDTSGKLYMATSYGDIAQTNYLLDKYKQLIMNTEVEEG